MKIQFIIALAIINWIFIGKRIVYGSFRFATAGAKQDAIVGNYSTYEGTVKIKVTAPLPRNQGQSPEVVVKYQACNEKSCLAPAVANLKLP